MGDSRKSAKRKLTLVLDDLRVVLFYGIDLLNKLKEVQNGNTKTKLYKRTKRSQYNKTHIVWMDTTMDTGNLLYGITKPLLAHIRIELQLKYN